MPETELCAKGHCELSVEEDDAVGNAEEYDTIAVGQKVMCKVHETCAGKVSHGEMYGGML